MYEKIGFGLYQTDEVIDVCLCLGWGGCSLACCWCPLKFPCVFLSHVFSLQKYLVLVTMKIL